MHTKFKSRAEALMTEARNVAAAAEDAGRDLTADEKATIDDRLAKAREQIDLGKRADETRQAFEDLGEQINGSEAKSINDEALQGARVGMGNGKSVGQAFVKSEQYKALHERFPSGHIGRDTRVSLDPYHVEGGMKALLTTGAATEDSPSSARVLTQPDKLGLVPFPDVAPRLRTVITNGTTGSDRIEYAQLQPRSSDAYVNAAAGVKESPDITGDVGVKPQSGFGFRKASADVITIAHWLPVTKQALSDAAQIRTMIDGFLSRGLEDEIERMIIEGNKTSPTKGEEEWNGIFNTTGVLDQSFQKDIYTTTRRAITKVTNQGGQVSAILVSPELDEQLDLMQDANGRFYGAGPFQLGPNTLWGRPRIVIPALSGRKKFVLGDLSQMVLWDRERATITATDSHADFFIRNLVAILAECRAGFGVLNPSLLVAGDEQSTTE